jgi:hypothetical protein
MAGSEAAYPHADIATKRAEIVAAVVAARAAEAAQSTEAKAAQEAEAARAASMEAKRAEVAAAVAAAKLQSERLRDPEAQEDSCNLDEDGGAEEEEVAMTAKRAAVAAAVAAAKNAAARKLTTKDLLGMDEVREEVQNSVPEVKDYRMQGNYGHTKFIKP